MNNIINPPAIVRPAEGLASLAAVANEQHEAGEGATRRGLEHFRAAGEALLRAKGQLGHGNWLAWVEKHLRFTERQARRYMTLAKSDVTSDLEEQWRIISGNGDEKSKPVHVSQNTGQPEWYTPAEYIEAARKVLGGIDLDPASSEIAQETVRAGEFYTAENEGLSKEWRGRVWLNPPYNAELIGQFVGKLCDHVQAGDVPAALLLVNNATETKWFQEASSVCRATCFPSGRIRFLNEHGDAEGAPLQGQSILYFGDRPEAFREEFQRFGFCVLKSAEEEATIGDGVRLLADAGRPDPPQATADTRREALEWKRQERREALAAALAAAPADAPEVRGVLTGDCEQVLRMLPPELAHLGFADVPFNIGYKYPGYDDDRPPTEYFAKMEACFRELRRIVAPTGSVMVACPVATQDKFKTMLERLDLHFVDTIIWHFNFGSNQGQRRLTPSYVLIHWFSVTRDEFTFNGAEILVPSARQKDYGDKRARPEGKVPDNFWEVPEGNGTDNVVEVPKNVWEVPRVCGTFDEREEHSCQMPVEIMERAVCMATNHGEMVLDPFAGPGTTLVAAKQLGRGYLGIELCPETADLARGRLLLSGS
jgi:site-specific DNA-methyltransferase (adenine-specific)